MANEKIEKEIIRINDALTEIRGMIDDDKRELLEEIDRLKSQVQQLR